MKGGNKMMKKLVMMVLVSLFLVGTVSVAQALTLVPDFTNILLNSTWAGYGVGGIDNPLESTDYLNYYVPDISISGTIRQNVYLNDTGLLFTFDLNNTATSGAGRVSSLNTANFAGFDIVAGYDGPGTTIAPDVANIDGGTITFFWLTNSLSLGETSPRLFIQTDAPFLTSGDFTLQGTLANGISTAIQKNYGWAPTAVPEPATASLLGMGLLGLLGFRRKKEA
jgi:hypothetical protein